MYELQRFQVHKGSPMFIEFLTMQSTVYSQYFFKYSNVKPFVNLALLRDFILFNV